MLKTRGHTIYKPLELIFKQALTTGVFTSEWKRSNTLLCYKKGNKQNLKKTTLQLLYFLSVENFLKESYLMKCLIFFWLTIS